MLTTTAHAIYAVAGGNHVTVLLDHLESSGTVDVIEVLAQPGGGPPPHRHNFGEWFEVLEGELTVCRERHGDIVPVTTLAAGDTLWVGPNRFHSTVNATDRPVRFRVIGQPGRMTGYFAEAGVRVVDELAEPARTPPGPAELKEISARWGIEFWPPAGS
jgi:quercetin dioxygenase-like cupin family protein